MRKLVLALGCALLAAGLAGCLGDEGADVDPSSSTGSGDLTPWQVGLADEYPTPDVAEHRSAEDRRSDVAEPGSPEFAPFDSAIQAWMEKHDVPTGQLAIMRDGQLRYERGYGYADEQETQPANARTMFRLASVTKPMTAALVSLQVEQGLYNWTDHVFCLGEDPPENCRLPIDPHPANPVQDERLADVQVEHLLEHTCGFGAEHNLLLFGDGALAVAGELGISPPPSAWRTVQYAMGEELAYEPGEQAQYSNLCYVLAGLVAEAATGARLEALYDAYLFEPLEVAGDIEPGRTLPEHHNPREPFYYCAEKEDESVFDPNETACEPYAESSLRTNLAAGGLIATAAATAAVYEVYGHHGSLYDPAGPFAWHFHGGGAPGTSTMAMSLAEGEDVSGDLQYVFLFNKRKKADHCQPTREAPLVAFGTGCDRSQLSIAMAELTAGWGTSQNDPGP